MKSLYRYASLLIATAAVAFAQSPSPQSSQHVTAGSRELFQTIARMDAKLFDAFNAHNLDAMMAMFTDDVDPADQLDRTQWPALKTRFAALIRTRTSAEWVTFFAGHEVCFAPVLSMSQARAHPHNIERRTFVDVDGAPHRRPRLASAERPARCCAGR